MSAVTTSIDLTYVKIAWTAPTNNFEALDAYEILIKQSDTSLSEYTTTCDGSDGTIVSQEYCKVPMSVLWASPYLLSANDLIEV
jgi:hypothetical protein